LCGSFNTNVIRKCLEMIQKNKDKEIHLFVIGKKAVDYFQRQNIRLWSAQSQPVGSGHFGNVFLVKTYSNVFHRLTLADGQRILSEIIAHHLQEGIGEAYLLFNEIKSIIRQEIVWRRMLPLEAPLPKTGKLAFDYLYEPAKPELLDELLPKYAAYRFYSVLLDANTAELAARMTAMDNASKNAHDLIQQVTLNMNKVRQAGITRELAEIVGASEVLR
jgi:F-type H+-transporting ATPase subunit gamma